MILSDEDILRCLRKGIIKIKPAPSPEQMGPASVDLTLDGVFWKFKEAAKRRVQDLSKVSFKDVTERVRAPAIKLAPGGMCLGITKEKITLPPDIIGTLEGRSRYARMGLAVHVTSALVQPGSQNRQVLEIVNFAPFPVTIHGGMRISQVMFEKLDSKTSKPYAKYGKVARRQ